MKRALITIALLAVLAPAVLFAPGELTLGGGLSPRVRGNLSRTPCALDIKTRQADSSGEYGFLAYPTGRSLSQIWQSGKSDRREALTFIGGHLGHPEDDFHYGFLQESSLFLCQVFT